MGLLLIDCNHWYWLSANACDHPSGQCFIRQTSAEQRRCKHTAARSNNVCNQQATKLLRYFGMSTLPSHQPFFTWITRVPLYQSTYPYECSRTISGFFFQNIPLSSPSDAYHETAAWADSISVKWDVRDCRRFSLVHTNDNRNASASKACTNSRRKVQLRCQIWWKTGMAHENCSPTKT